MSSFLFGIPSISGNGSRVTFPFQSSAILNDSNFASFTRERYLQHSKIKFVSPYLLATERKIVNYFCTYHCDQLAKNVEFISLYVALCAKILSSVEKMSSSE